MLRQPAEVYLLEAGHQGPDSLETRRETTSFATRRIGRHTHDEIAVGENLEPAHATFEREFEQAAQGKEFGLVVAAGMARRAREFVVFAPGAAKQAAHADPARIRQGATVAPAKPGLFGFHGLLAVFRRARVPLQAFAVGELGRNRREG